MPVISRLSVLLLSGLLACSVLAQAPLNVLLITADDLGMQLNCYGDPTVPTPNLDALADRSVRFETAYVAQASCSSSRSAMLTGIYPHTNGQYGLANAGVGFRVQSERIAKSIPNILKQHGYRTGVIGKLHVDPEPEFAFDVRQKEGFGNRDVRKQVDFAKTFWKQSGDQPWFLMFNVFDPHVVGKSDKNSSAFPDVVDGLPTSPIGPADVTPWPWQGIDTPVMRKRIAGYYNCVQRVDAAIGMLMQSLEATGQRHRTLVIFLGDHGPPFSRGKTTCYEAGLRVPFLLDWPDVSQPHISQKLVSAVDIAPTVFDAIGADIPAAVQGESLRGIATETTNAAWRQTLVGEFHFHGAGSFCPTRAITDGRYKLIHRLPGRVGKPMVTVDGDPSSRELEKLPADHPAHAVYARLEQPPQWEFYDLKADPHELVNLDGEASVAVAQSRLKDALLSWQAKTDDPFRDEAFSARVAGQYMGASNSRVRKAVDLVQQAVDNATEPNASLDNSFADDNVVLVDGFDGHLDGPLMPMVGPTPEYHFVHAMVTGGQWLVTAFGTHPQDQVGWRIFREGKRKDLAFFHTSTDKHWHPTVATGDHDWRDYNVSLQLVPNSKQGRCGITVRSENDRCYVFVGLHDSTASLIRVRHEVAFREPGETVLAEHAISRVPGQPISIVATVNGNELTAIIGNVTLRCDLSNDPFGGVGLQTDGPAVFRDVKIECSADELVRIARVRADRQAEIDAIDAQYPIPKLWKVIQTKDFGCDRNLRFGDLTGDGRPEIVFGQIQHHGPRDANSEVSCLTAVDLDGTTLWSIGTPDRYRHHLTNDVGFQVHDLDGDGKAEVIYCKDQEIRIANGLTGETIRKAATPTNPNRKPPANLFPRILGDCLTFADLTGQGRATDLMIKDRYGNLWAYDSELNPLWEINCNTGHFPFPIDLDHDGKDEIFVGYSLVDSDGTFLWTRDDQYQDHADAIAAIDLDGDQRVEVLWAGSDEGLVWLGEEGIPRTHLRLGHTQNLTIADLRPELPGLEVAVVNFWKNQGLLHIIDAKGNVIESLEPRGDHGSAMPAVNWAGDRSELLFVNPDPRAGGLMDGHGRFIVRLPADGHPTLAYDAIDLTGDARDELVVWDSRELWIYTADDSPSTAPLAVPILSRVRNPRFNESNYRSRISIPRP